MKTILVLVIGVLYVNCKTYNDPNKLDIASFNVQIFGKKKMSNTKTKATLTKIIRLYDLILIQEIRDAEGKAIIELLELVNKGEESSKRYKMVISERLGRTNSKEQYAMIYRVDWLKPTASYTYADRKDVFEREPFVVRFKSSKTDINDFAVLNIHTSPDDAEEEISHLVDVYEDIQAKWDLNDVMIMGDYNADCTYVNKWEKVKLATDKRFYWLVDDTHDTTTKSTDCTYDRIVVAGEKMIKAISPLSPSVLHFDEEFNLTQKETVRLSDHFPVSVQIESTSLQNIDVYPAFKIRDANLNKKLRKTYKKIKKRSMITKWRALSRQKSQFHFTALSKRINRRSYLEMVVSTTVVGLENVAKGLRDLKNVFGGVISEMQIDRVKSLVREQDPLRYVARGYGRYQTLYNYYKDAHQGCTVSLICNARKTLECSVTVSFIKGPVKE